ncbi:beta-ketoacyl synthase [Bacteroides sp. 224]|uniref:beta-ketoacyl-[acyl-carrier-protein] synthase family protein n=1 Tax=Bacteroides sp. 224 TaxID=2302936 RepID=UPI0013D6A1CF|nr:beta-ketoacyl-[acyl-carrier-protein] synthase family protein [Bacteroides sp. 224]NDV66994.1 beta-ketoacyl-[acyl-carrier-protein] synthase family protein [Bacteroides sp. 224]
MRVYVTGLGVVSGIGLNVEENIASLIAGKHGMEKTTLFSTQLDVPVSEVKLTNTTLKEKLGLDIKHTYSRTALLGMQAAQEAVNDANIDVHALRTGFISSTSVGGMDLSEQFYIPFRQDPLKGRLREVASHDCGDSTERIASYLGIQGFITTISTACSSAANAIMLGARLIKCGYLDTAIVGGTDALCRFTLNGFNSLMILDKEHCRPFDHTRAGLNLGEGAGYLVLQSEKSMTRTPYCELTGYANTNEAYHQTGSSPEGDGPYKSMSEAISQSGIPKEEIDYINVHGTGTPNNDLSEGMALKRLFGEKVPPFSSVKAFIGHTLGASEGIEAVYSVLAIHRGMMYPNLNFQTPIEETGLSPVGTLRQKEEIRHVLSNSFGFGGSNSSLLFSKVKAL